MDDATQSRAGKTDNRSELRWRRFNRCLLAADNTFGLGRALVDMGAVMFVMAGDKKFTEIFSTETDVARFAWSGNNEIHASCLVTDLDTKRRGDVEPAVGVHTHGMGSRWKWQSVRIFSEVKVLRMLEQWRFHPKLHAVDPAIVTCDVEQALIGRETN